MTDNTVVTSSGFYTPCEQTDSSALAYCTAGVSDVQPTSTARSAVSFIHNVATSPELDHTMDEMEEQPPIQRRQRSFSAPSVLYQQVALQLRDISDDFNREYSRDEVQKRFVNALVLLLSCNNCKLFIHMPLLQRTQPSNM